MRYYIFKTFSSITSLIFIRNSIIMFLSILPHPPPVCLYFEIIMVSTTAARKLPREESSCGWATAMLDGK